MKSESPQIDPRKFSEIAGLLQRLAPHYTPEWPATEEKDSGAALLKVFSHLAETIIKRLNQTPHKNFTAFLSMLGIKLLPAQPARAALHFKLAEGASSEVLIPNRTRATSSATTDRAELPFETEEDLLATPSRLARVYGIDPTKDAIYEPPRGFLERELPDQSRVRYRLISFSRAGSNTLQLDHTDNLEEGDLLKLGSAVSNGNGATKDCTCLARTPAENGASDAPVEYVTVAGKKGTIVELTTKLTRDYLPEAPLEKIAQFHVFESKNLQEHILFLGHKDLFNVKSPAQFTLTITHLAGAQAGLEPLDIAWEYWGEVKGLEGQDWRKFNVDFDGSFGFSQSGEIILIKPTEGEITEYEGVNNTKSRWIRARLREPLPTTETRRLPVLDNIAFVVKSAGEALPPDQAFHNDTPLDFNLAFYPFGLEPRLFDKFQLGSKEVFSKKRAQITIAVQLDSIAILAAPTAVLTKDADEKIVNVFARGTGGRLLELRITFAKDSTAGEPDWIDHGLPEDTVLALPDPKLGTEARPAVILLKDGVILVFAKAESGHLLEYFIKGDDRVWFARAISVSDVKVKFDPAAAQSGENEVKVFVVGEDGVLYVLQRNLNLNSAAWESRGKPEGKNLDSSPCAARCENSFYTKVFVKGNDDALYEWDENDREWRSHPAAGFTVAARPFAQLKCEGDAQNPSPVLVLEAKATEVNARDFELSKVPGAYNGLQIKIESSTIEPKTKLEQGATIKTYKVDRSVQLNLPRWIRIPAAGSDYEIFTGTSGNVVAATGSKRITLESGASEVSEAYVGLSIDISNTSSGEITSRTVAQYDGKARTLTLNSPLDFVPDKSFQYRIRTGHEGTVREVAGGIIKIDRAHLASDGAYKLLGIALFDGDGNIVQTRHITNFKRDTLELTVDQAWNPIPVFNQKYSIFDLVGNIQGASPATITLEATASEQRGAYTGLTITVLTQDGGTAKEQKAKIISYQNESGARIAEVDRAWDPLPAPELKATYQIGNFKGKIKSASGFAVYEKAWVQDETGELRELDTHLPADSRWKNLGAPSAQIKVASAPHGFVEQMGTALEERHIFVRGSDGHLWERKRDDPTPPANGDSAWEAHLAPIEAELRHSPFLLRFPQETKRYSVFSGSNKNSILERELKLANGVTGAAQVGTNFSITLDDAEKPDFTSGTYYLKITAGKLAGVLRRIKDYMEMTPSGRLVQLAHLVWGWAIDPDKVDPEKDLPDSTSAYKIGMEAHAGSVQDRDMATITLAHEASQENDAYNGFSVIITDANGNPTPAGNANKILDYTGENRLATLESPWQAVPIPATDFYKINLEHAGIPREPTPAAIILDAEASENDDAYNGMKISVTRGSATVENEIVSYIGGSTKKASVKNNWPSDQLPLSGDAYVLTALDPTIKRRPQGASNPTIKLLGSSTITGAYNDLPITVIDANNVEQQKGIATYVYDASNNVGIATLGEGWEGDEAPDGTYSYVFRSLEHGNVNPQQVDIEIGPTTIYLNVAAVEEVGGDKGGAFDGFEITVIGPDETLRPRRQRTRAAIASTTQTRMITSFLVLKQNDQLVEAIATVDRAWDFIDPNDEKLGRRIPDHTYTYSVRAVPRAVQSAELATITLQADDPLANNPLEELSLEVHQEGNSTPQTKVIKAYVPAQTLVKVGGVWSPVPNDSTKFFYAIKDEGVVQEATRASIKLDPTENKATQNKGAYDGLQLIVVKDEGEGQPRQEVKITEYLGGEDRLAYVDANWNPDLLPLGASPSYEIKVKPLHPQSVSASRITLDSAPTGELVEMDILVGDRDLPARQQVRTITAYDSATRIALVDKPWDTVPEIGAAFFLINYKKPERNLIHTGTAQVGTQHTITLDQNASANSGEYERRKLAITDGPGKPTPQIIDEYLGPDRLAILEPGAPEPWQQKPNTTSKYEVEGEISKKWIPYEEDTEVAPITPQLSWEYWNGKGWVAFQKEVHEFRDGTKDLLVDGDIVFNLPEDIDLTEVSGQENYWVRARIIGGDYGLPTFTLREEVKGIPNEVVKETRLVPDKKSIRPPLIVSLKISYELIDKRFPELCLTYNNLDFIDQTAACITTDKRFPPFVRLEGQDLEAECLAETKSANAGATTNSAPAPLGKAIYLGFANSFKGGPIKIFFAAKELPYSDANKPKVEWTYRGENEWQRLSFKDDTEGLIKQEILQFIAPEDLTPATRFGSFQHWIRGMLREGSYEETPVLRGIYPNTTWAFQAETIRDEALGSSNGEAHQTFRFFRFPVRENEIVRVREVLTEEEKENLKQAFGEQALHEVRDESGKVLETWVLWQEAENFFDSTAADRHYTLDRATGELRFGDGRNGQIPPASLNNVRVFSYQAGGGSPGNVEAGAIQNLATAIASVDAVINPAEAGGGSDTATLEDMLEIGPAMISHRQRAVTPADFEWLAKQASRLIAKARCVRNTNLKNNRETGWVTVFIVPASKEATPSPSLELRRSVRDFLEAHCANTVSATRHVFVDGPRYFKINVAADIFVRSIEAAAEAERSARDQLAKFFHPLTGGPRARGWEFGEKVSASDVYALLENLESVDHLENLALGYEGAENGDVVEIAPNGLVAFGAASLNILLRN